jgi:hypothetical protein
MKPTFYSLIIMSPQSPRLQRIHISRQAIPILVAAFFLSFSITVALLLSFPRIQVKDADRSRLAAENQTLKIENKNAALRIEKLDTQMSRVEQTARRITDLFED